MQRPTTLDNIGLYHKYRGAWAESFRYNKRAVEIRPTTEAANWNLAIAATALRDKTTARAAGRWIEDWSGDVRMLCKACSEGRAHEAHDHDGGTGPWKPERQIGIAAGSEEEVEQLLDQWIGPGREVKSWGVALER